MVKVVKGRPKGPKKIGAVSPMQSERMLAQKQMGIQQGEWALLGSACRSGSPQLTDCAHIIEREQPGVAFNRKHADTLAMMPMQEKMKAFESASDDSRRNFWLQRAEEKKALAAKPKAPKVRAGCTQIRSAVSHACTAGQGTDTAS